MRGTLPLVKNHRIVAIHRHRYNRHALTTSQIPSNRAHPIPKKRYVLTPVGIMHGIMLLINSAVVNKKIWETFSDGAPSPALPPCR